MLFASITSRSKSIIYLTAFVLDRFGSWLNFLIPLLILMRLVVGLLSTEFAESAIVGGLQRCHSL